MSKHAAEVLACGIFLWWQSWLRNIALALETNYMVEDLVFEESVLFLQSTAVFLAGMKNTNS